MPITSHEFQRIIGIKNYSIHKDITIYDYINKYINAGRIIFPKWQRDDCWDDEYRTTLIEALLLKSDLPKLYLSNFNDINSNINKYYILDGGHRTRAIARYMNNEYSITIDDDSVYYDNAPVDHNTRHNRVMNNHEKNQLDNYLLTITIYDNLTEKESRKIFNQLQNSRPMTMADIVNSHESPLVDYLRSLGEFIIDGQKLHIYFDNYNKILGKSGNSQMLYQLASWFPICFPIIVGDNKADNALNYVLKSEKKDAPSTVYKYILENDEDITKEEQLLFEKYLTQLIRQIFVFKTKL